MTNNEVIKEIDSIDLAHMNIEINPNEFLFGNEMAGKKLALYLVQGYYKTNIAKILSTSPGLDEDKIPVQLKLQALVYAKYYATNKASHELDQVVHAAMIHLLDDANKTGWYKYLAEEGSGEYDTLEELLANMVDASEEQSPKWYNGKFLAQELFPMARSLGIDPDSILVTAQQTKKVSVLVPAARMLLEQHAKGTINTKKVKEDMTWMLSMAANVKIPFSQLDSEMKRYRGIITSEDPIAGSIYMVEKDRILLVVEANYRDKKMIEMALRNRVDFKLRDIGELFQKLLPDLNQEEFGTAKIRDLFRRLQEGTIEMREPNEHKTDEG